MSNLTQSLGNIGLLKKNILLLVLLPRLYLLKRQDFSPIDRDWFHPVYWFKLQLDKFTEAAPEHPLKHIYLFASGSRSRLEKYTLASGSQSRLEKYTLASGSRRRLEKYTPQLSLSSDTRLSSQ